MTGNSQCIRVLSVIVQFDRTRYKETLRDGRCHRSAGGAGHFNIIHLLSDDFIRWYDGVILPPRNEIDCSVFFKDISVFCGSKKVTLVGSFTLVKKLLY